MLRFNGASWAEVTDRERQDLAVAIGRQVAEHALDGELPLTVVIGDANKATVEVRGEAFNLAPGYAQQRCAFHCPIACR